MKVLLKTLFILSVFACQNLMAQTSCGVGGSLCGSNCCPTTLVCQDATTGTCGCPETLPVSCGTNNCCTSSQYCNSENQCASCPGGTMLCGFDSCCPTTGASCIKGVCMCSDERAFCNNTCCAEGSICQEGQCSPCPKEQLACQTQCCFPGQVCVEGKCQCMEGMTLCNEKICCYEDECDESTGTC